MKKWVSVLKHSVLMNVSALLGVVALNSANAASAWYVYNGEVPEELLK